MRAIKPPGGSGVLEQAARYGAVVGSGYLLAIALYPLELAAGIPPYLAFGLTFALNAGYNFTLLRLWAFPPSGRRWHSDLARFAVVAALSLLLNYGAFAALYASAALGAPTAQRLAIAIAAPPTFLANRWWSFRRRRAPAHAAEEMPATSSRKESYSRM